MSKLGINACWLFQIGLYIFLISLFSYCFYQKYQHLKIKKWLKHFNLNQHSSYFHEVCSTVDGFKISRQARQQGDAFEFVYGEIDFLSFIALLSLVKPNSETIFYDLGSGVGKPSIACAMVFPIKKSCGIELFHELHNCAIQLKRRLENIQFYSEQAKKITFIQGNFLTAEIQEATLIFINATGFFGKTWELLNQRLTLAGNCHTVISISKPLSSLAFAHVHRTHVRMSWGIATAYIQHRLL